MNNANVVNNQELVIHTTVPEIKVGEISINADRRSSKEEKVSDAERIRRVILPTGTWGELSASKDGEKNQSLTDILRESLKKLASDKLRDMLQENPMLRTVAIKEMTVAEILKWSEETATSRGSITFTREQAESWIAASKTMQECQQRWATAGDTPATITVKAAFIKNRIGALAARNHGIAKVEDATKLMALINSDDAASSVGTEVVGRLEHIIKSLTAKAAEATISMDDL